MSTSKKAALINPFSQYPEKSDVRCARQYARFVQCSHPKPLLTTEAKIEAFLTSLALKGVSASTQNQAFNALLFLYRYALKQELGNINALRTMRPATLRYCPDRYETLKLLVHVEDLYGYPTRLLGHLLYACGLRVFEPLNLRMPSRAPRTSTALRQDPPPTRRRPSNSGCPAGTLG